MVALGRGGVFYERGTPVTPHPQQFQSVSWVRRVEAPDTLHPTPCTLHTTPYTPYTLHPTPCTLLETRHPNPLQSVSRVRRVEALAASLKTPSPKPPDYNLRILANLVIHDSG